MKPAPPTLCECPEEVLCLRLTPVSSPLSSRDHQIPSREFHPLFSRDHQPPSRELHVVVDSVNSDWSAGYHLLYVATHALL